MHQFSKLTQKIQLTPKEQEIFDCFQNFVKETHLTTQLRVAGGWVRDKLLSRDSNDIDIALDNMMGAEFVKLMNTYLDQTYHEKAHGFGVTKFNPDKSKHLETACVRIRDVWVDVVNLRGETYTENSRIPQMTIGTPIEDAERRDLTINSLFYNLNEGIVEDFTGQGLSDLENGIIRTPMDPVKTFLDDPLRILRTIRFSARFQYTIVPEILEALKNPDLRDAFRNKVSRERVGIELNLMLNSPSIYICLELISLNNLWDLVFEPPKMVEPIQGFQICQSVQKNLYRLQDYIILKSKVDTKTIHFYAFLTAICYPYHTVKYQQGKQILPSSNYILSESLKMPKKETQQTLLLIEQAISLKNIINLDNFEMIVKWLQDAGPMWELSVFIAYCAENSNYERFQKFIDFVYYKQLHNFFETKPLINGNEVSSFVGVKPGPEFKSILQNVMMWQARFPLGKKEDLISELKENPQSFYLNK